MSRIFYINLSLFCLRLNTPGYWSPFLAQPAFLTIDLGADIGGRQPIRGWPGTQPGKWSTVRGSFLLPAPGRDVPATTRCPTARLPLADPGMPGWAARQSRAYALSLVGRASGPAKLEEDIGQETLCLPHTCSVISKALFENNSCLLRLFHLHLANHTSKKGADRE